MNKTHFIGTNSPRTMMAFNFSPSSDPDATSSLNKSPDEMCFNAKAVFMRSHCVPLPHPGPPTTNNTVTLANNLSFSAETVFSNAASTSSSWPQSISAKRSRFLNSAKTGAAFLWKFFIVSQAAASSSSPTLETTRRSSVASGTWENVNKDAC